MCSLDTHRVAPFKPLIQSLGKCTVRSWGPPCPSLSFYATVSVLGCFGILSIFWETDVEGGFLTAGPELIRFILRYLCVHCISVLVATLTFRGFSDVSPKTYPPLRISSLPFLDLLCYAVVMTAYLNFCDLRLRVGPLKILSILKFVLNNPTLFLSSFPRM